MRALHAKTKRVRLYTYRAAKIENKMEWVKPPANFKLILGTILNCPKTGQKLYVHIVKLFYDYIV